VDRVDPGVDDGYTVALRGGASVTVSRRQARQLRERLGL
jgi:DNA-binding LytR/AlgR family response regulator